MTTTAHPRQVGFDERHRRAQIQRAPAPAPISEVKAGAAPPADPAAVALAPARPGRHDDLSLIADLHVLNHRSLQAQSPATRPIPLSRARRIPLLAVPAVKKPEP